MNWNEVISDPCLQDLPYKIELDRYGQIVMSPASNRHSYFQGRISRILEDLGPEGKTLPECSIDTDEGVKVADVAWLSPAFFEAHEFVTPYPLSPDLCIEVISPSNSRKAMEFKRDLFFSQGAKEVWFCDSEGQIEYFLPGRAADSSSLFPNFLNQI